MPFFFTRKSLFLKNKRLLLFYADSYIDELEKDAPGMSCKEDLMKAITKEIDNSEKGITLLSEKSDDFKSIAKRLVSNNAYNLIELGKYHLHGHINLFGPAKNLIYIHKTAVKEFMEYGYITFEEYQEDLLALDEAINQRL